MVVTELSQVCSAAGTGRMRGSCMLGAENPPSAGAGCGLSPAGTIKFSAEPSPLYFCGGRQLHDGIQIHSQHENIRQSRGPADVLKNSQGSVVIFFPLGLPLEQMTEQEMAVKEAANACAAFPFSQICEYLAYPVSSKQAMVFQDITGTW